MTEQRLEADKAETAGTHNWSETVRPENADSPPLTWRAVRAAICASGKTFRCLESHDLIQKQFFDLKDTTLAGATAMLDETIERYSSMAKRANDSEAGKIIRAQCEGAKKAKEALNREMGVAVSRAA